MGWIEELRGKIVGMDTAPFFEAVERNEFTVVTSIVTLLEVLVHPIRAGDSKLAQRYRDLLFHSKGLTTISLTQEIAEEAARLRGTYRKIRTPDAIHIATAINANAAFFLTNDMSLPPLSNLKMLQLDELKTSQ